MARQGVGRRTTSSSSPTRSSITSPPAANAESHVRPKARRLTTPFARIRRSPFPSTPDGICAQAPIVARDPKSRSANARVLRTGLRLGIQNRRQAQQERCSPDCRRGYEQKQIMLAPDVPGQVARDCRKSMCDTRSHVVSELPIGGSVEM